MNDTRLIAFLRSKQADDYFGRTFVIRADVLAHHLTGEGTLTAIAIKHQVTKAAMTRHARRVRKVFGSKPNVDFKP